MLLSFRLWNAQFAEELAGLGPLRAWRLSLANTKSLKA